MNLFGFDLLFQDVNIVLYIGPLPLFHEVNGPNHDEDIIFQDDENRSTRISPSSANS